MSFRNVIFRPLDVPAVLADSLETTRKMRKTTGGSAIFWKLLVSFPGPCDSAARESVGGKGLPVTPGLIRQKLKRGISSQNSDVAAALTHKLELLSLYKAEVRQRHGQMLKFGVCIKV